METESNNSTENGYIVKHPFRKAVLRGLAVVFPPLFTILIFAWVVYTTHFYVLAPVTAGVRWTLVWGLSTDWGFSSNIVEEKDLSQKDPPQTEDGTEYRQLENGTYVPAYVYQMVALHCKQAQAAGDEAELPKTGKQMYREYVNLKFLRPLIAVPFFLALFIVLLYLLGKFMAAGIGRFFWHRFEQFIHRLPLVRTVYSSVKQVTDFFFTEREIEYLKVVAVEYPRKGIFSLGLVTGESMLDLRSAANEPVLSVLMPTSPLPMTGFTVTVRKSETIDLNITIDQAFQFIVSCGVVVPPQQLRRIQQAAPDELPAPDDADEPAGPTGGGPKEEPKP